MTKRQLLYLAALLVATALALVPLTLMIASRQSARSEPVLYIIPYKSDNGVGYAQT